MLLNGIIFFVCELFVFFIFLLYFQSRCTSAKQLSELGLPYSIIAPDIPHVWDRARTYEEETTLFAQFSGLVYYSEITGKANALFTFIHPQVSYINNTGDGSLTISFFASCFIMRFVFFRIDLLNVFSRLSLMAMLIVFTISIVYLAYFISTHRRRDRFYSRLYDELEETYTHTFNNPPETNEFCFSIKSYSVMVLYEHYVDCLKRHADGNRTKLSKAIGALVLSIMFFIFSICIFAFI